MENMQQLLNALDSYMTVRDCTYIHVDKTTNIKDKDKCIKVNDLGYVKFNREIKSKFLRNIVERFKGRYKPYTLYTKCSEDIQDVSYDSAKMLDKLELMPCSVEHCIVDGDIVFRHPTLDFVKILGVNKLNQYKYTWINVDNFTGTLPAIQDAQFRVGNSNIDIGNDTKKLSLAAARSQLKLVNVENTESLDVSNCQCQFIYQDGVRSTLNIAARDSSINIACNMYTYCKVKLNFNGEQHLNRCTVDLSGIINHETLMNLEIKSTSEAEIHLRDVSQLILMHNMLKKNYEYLGIVDDHFYCWNHSHNEWPLGRLDFTFDIVNYAGLIPLIKTQILDLHTYIIERGDVMQGKDLINTIYAVLHDTCSKTHCTDFDDILYHSGSIYGYNNKRVYRLDTKNTW